MSIPYRIAGVALIAGLLLTPLRPGAQQPDHPVSDSRTRAVDPGEKLIGKSLTVLDLEVTGDTSDTLRAGEWDQRSARMTEVLRSELRKEGLFAVADNTPADRVIAHWKSTQRLDACNGCELDIAKQLGTNLVLIGTVFRMSQLVLWLRVEIKDVATGRTVMRNVLSFRGDNDASWTRAISFLVRDMKGASGFVQYQ